VKAKITMKTTEEGGRQSGFISGYRPNHVFEMPENLKNLRTYIGDIQFDDQDLIEPGETL
jgi:translation elongation factor EF-Tu-like GTPase